LDYSVLEWFPPLLHVSAQLDTLVWCSFYLPIIVTALVVFS